jgi:hypothetical protein
MFRLLKALPLALALAASTFFTTSCSSSSQFRVVDAIPDAPVGLDVDVNGINAFTTPFAFGTFGSVEPSSGYQKVSAGSDSIEVFQTGTTTPVIPSTSISFGGASQYTVVLAGRYASPPTALQFTDNNTAPTSGNVEFRIIHASPSTAAVDIYIIPPLTDVCSVPTKTFTNINFQAASPSYASVAPAPYSVIATYAGTCQIILSQDYPQGTAGMISTMVLVDQPGGGLPPQWLPLTDVQ